MLPNVEPVKAPAEGVRRRRASETRRRVLAAGYRLFTERGYGSTTLGAVAKLAEVHVQTVHFTFHTKSALFIEVVRTYSAGEDPPRPVAQRPWMREAFASPVALRSIALVVEFGSEIYRSVAPLVPALTSAAQAEPSVAAFAEAVAADRRTGMRALMTSIAAKGQLRTDRTVDQCADIVFTLHNAETYLTLVVGFGWTVEAYKVWLYDALCEQILKPVTRLERRRAARGLTFSRRSKAASPADTVRARPAAARTGPNEERRPWITSRAREHPKGAC